MIELEDAWNTITNLIKNKQTFDLGTLNYICCIVTKQISLINEKNLVQQFYKFIEEIYSFCKQQKNAEHIGQSLSLIVLDSIIFNLYYKYRPNIENAKRSNSFYSMSMSQMSASLSEMSNHHQRDLKKIISIIQRIASHQLLFKKIGLTLKHTNHQEKNKRYAQNLIETIDYILNKQKCNKQAYNKIKAVHIVLPQKRKNQLNIDRVNDVIFSNQLNKIKSLLSEGSHEICFAISRIYFASIINESKNGQQRQHFQKIQYQASQMLFNLQMCYIQSYDSQVQLFEQSKNPLYKLIKTYLTCLFLPTWRKFNKIIFQLAQNCDDQNSYTFYKKNETLIQNLLIQFIKKLPFELTKHLHNIFKIIDQNLKQERSSVVPVKKLIVYSFFINSQLIQDLLDIDASRYVYVYNHIINLFFQSSLKKYTQGNYSSLQMQYISRITEHISNELDNKIIHFDQNYIQEEINQESFFLSAYQIQQPIINHDYEIINQLLNQISFTPKDMKIFQMKKQQQYSLQSPVFKHFKKQNSIIMEPYFCENQEEKQSQEIDLATWMSVGGNRNYEQTHPISNRKTNRLTFESFPKAKVKQINKLYDEFVQSMMEL